MTTPACSFAIAPAALRVRAGSARGRAWLAACLVLLVLAQGLGFMHRIAHVPGQPPALAQAVQTLHAHARHWTHDLFAGHTDADCRLLDAVTHPACPAAPVLALPLQLASVHLAATHGEFVARFAALFDARGPPAFLH